MVEAGKSRIWNLQHQLAGWRPRKQPMLQLGSKGLLTSGHLSLSLLSPYTDCMMSTYIMEGNLLYAKSTDSNVSLILKIPSQ